MRYRSVKSGSHSQFAGFDDVLRLQIFFPWPSLILIDIGLDDTGTNATDAFFPARKICSVLTVDNAETMPFL